MREILAAHLGCCPRKLRVREGANARPWVDAIFFSVSSTGDLAAMAVCRDAQVGLDIEAVAPLDLPTLRRSLSRSERASLRALPESERAHAFCRAWTRKEAYLKARGDGLRIDPRECEVTLGPEARLLACPRDEPNRWALHTFRAAEDVEGALCLAVR